MRRAICTSRDDAADAAAGPAFHATPVGNSVAPVITLGLGIFPSFGTGEDVLCPG